MAYEFLKVRNEDKVRIIQISRPKALNALNTGVLNELYQELKNAEMDENCLVVIITGEGKAFVAGGDIAQMSKTNPAEALEFARTGHEVLRYVESMSKVVIAAVNGYALGGGSELALGCDMVIAEKSAKIGQPEVKLGIIPGFGGTQRLTRLAGRNMAKEWILTGAMYTAEEAMRIGFVNRVVDDGQALSEALKMARQVAANGPVAVAAAKRAINEGVQMPLNQALDYEASLFANLFDTHDQKEGTKAFLEKRAPDFKGK
jgi:enoyl-CoA hydratase